MSIRVRPAQTGRGTLGEGQCSACDERSVIVIEVQTSAHQQWSMRFCKTCRDILRTSLSP